MSRRNRRLNNENKIMLMLGGGIILIGIVAFIISYVIFSNNIQSRSRISVNNDIDSNSNTVNMITESASSSIGKSVNEVENSTKIAINTSIQNEEKNSESQNTEVESSNETKTKEEENLQENNDDENVEEVEVAGIEFLAPVEGEILKEYSKDNLIYSETLEEWTTHLGIDFKANKTEVVKASADGIIKSIKNDPRYGLTIVIEHTNGFESIYSSLLSSEFVTVGENVRAGDAIGTVGNTATFEIADETHLHFEVKLDGKNIDPSIYLK